jgi:hypothetical protein
MLANPERVAEIAIRAFGRGKDEAIAVQTRLAGPCGRSHIRRGRLAEWECA